MKKIEKDIFECYNISVGKRLNLADIGVICSMTDEKHVDPLVSMQQELCDMWGIDNQTKYIFDEETTVQDIVKKQIAQGKNMADNFKFVKSETNIFVQLSDVVAGILGKMFKHINSTGVNQRRKDIQSLSKIQVDNILLIDKLRMEADRENPGFLCSIGPWDGIGILNSFFEMVRNREEK